METGNGKVVLGRPIRNAQVYILDEEQEPAPVGVGGEAVHRRRGSGERVCEARRRDRREVRAEPVWRRSREEDVSDRRSSEV